MDQNKSRLGKGLDALIPKNKNEGSNEIDLDLISPNPLQPRKNFDESKMKELYNSVLDNGVLQPIIVREIEDRYEIVAGERRFRAAQLAKLESIPAIVKDVADEKSIEIAIIENVQREDLNPIEEAEAYAMLLEKYGYTQEKLGKKLGKSRTSITNTIRLLKLPEKIKTYLISGQLSSGHARALLSIKSEDEQVKLADKIVAHGLSVREVEKIIKNKNGKTEVKREERKPEHLIEMESTLTGFLGTKVKIKGTEKNKGKIEIEFYSKGDLERIIETIGLK